MIGMTPEQRHALPKIADGTRAFEEKCQAYMTTRPELVPGYVDLAELAKDRKLVADLMPCLQMLLPLAQAMEDTVTLAYSDIYVSDLGFYQSIRQAAKRGMAGTDTIYDDLQERFPGRPKKVVPPPP
jgi:hypothetical protein